MLFGVNVVTMNITTNIVPTMRTEHNILTSVTGIYFHVPRNPVVSWVSVH